MADAIIRIYEYTNIDERGNEDGKQFFSAHNTHF